MNRTPFLVSFAEERPVRADEPDAPTLQLEYCTVLQRNRVLVGSVMVDVAEAPSTLSGRELLTMTRGSTMTQVEGQAPGTYKLDDDSD